MKKILISALAMLLCLAACEPVEETIEATMPTIELTKGEATATTISFGVKHTNATEAAYLVLPKNEQLPTLEEILASGESLDVLQENVLYTVTVENLTPETEYQVIAVARNTTINDSKTAGSNKLFMATSAYGEIVVTVDIVNVGHDKINFRVKSENAEKLAWVVMPASKEAPTAGYVMLNGEEIEPNSPEAVEAAGLESAKEYKLIVAAEGNGEAVIAATVPFTTEDDPDKVIKHNYTRARGTKYGSSYFMMFSYEDANEADNFAYDDTTLSLDFYGDPEKDYLPAGTYEVKESTEWPCVSSYRYSTYGYDNGLTLKSGVATVAIDPETKAYTFDIDLILVDGRHLVATYSGNVDNMPVIDIETHAIAFNTATAAPSNDGKTWTLNLADEKGNAAAFTIYNSYDAPYIVKNIYTISTSDENTPDLPEAGQFDAYASTITFEGDSSAKLFTSGSLHVDLDWQRKVYILAFYGNVGKEHVIEAEFEGSVEGISLEQSTEIIDVMMNRASARSYESQTNWYMTFTQTDANNEEKYRLVLDLFSPAADYLPVGYYRLGVGSGEGYIKGDSSSITVAGETTHEVVDASANVNIDGKTLEYSFDISVKIADGRTFKFGYVGNVEGIEVTLPGDDSSDIEWATFTAKHWYSDNWEIAITDTEGKHKLVFDMRTGDSSLTYIPSGLYTFGESGAYIDDYYSTYNGNKGSFSAATLNLEYIEASQTYKLSFEATLNSGTTLKGNYEGPISGTPK